MIINIQIQGFNYLYKNNLITRGLSGLINDSRAQLPDQYKIYTKWSEGVIPEKKCEGTTNFRPSDITYLKDKAKVARQVGFSILPFCIIRIYRSALPLGSPRIR